MSAWINTHGRHGIWTRMLHGQRLKIIYVDYDFTGEGKHYRIQSRYGSEMFANQFYKTLKEAQNAAEQMLTRHLKQRETEGLKVIWD